MARKDWGEQWIAYRMFQEFKKRKEEQQHDYSSIYRYHSDTDDTFWRYSCEDGSDYDLDPEDFETEEEYEEALEEAKNDRSEQWSFEESTKEEEHDDFSPDYKDFFVIEDGDEYLMDISWRDFCEDGSDYDLDPEDFETEKEYEEALEEAKEKIAWREEVDYWSRYGIDPEDFDTKEEYKEALEEAWEYEFEEEREYGGDDALDFDISPQCYEEYPALDRGEEFHVEVIHMEENTAADYLSNTGDFRYARAIKDNFKLPISLPDEDGYREYELSEALCKIAKRNVALSFEVWEWVLATFLPYIQYADRSLVEMTSSVINDLYCFPENYRTELARYMDEHTDFLEKVLDENAEMPYNLDVLIAAALQDGLMDTALTLFKRGLVQAGNNWKEINRLMDGTISECKNYTELESAEYIKENMLPLVKAIDIGMVQDEIGDWEEMLDEYISLVEDDCEQYAYTRKNAWRKNVPDGSKYGLDPRYYDSEQEYQSAYNARQNEKREREQREQARRMEMEKARLDDKIYIFCGVMFPDALHPYHYRTEDSTIQVGDEVIVPARDKETTGTVVSVGRYMRVAAPYPIEKTKFIIGKEHKKEAGIPPEIHGKD